MPVVALSGGEIALIVLAAFWGLLVLFLVFVLVRTSRLLQSATLLVDQVRSETAPMLGEVSAMLQTVNRDLGNVGPIMESTRRMTRSAANVTWVVEQALATPLVKVISLSAGLSRGIKRFRGER